MRFLILALMIALLPMRSWANQVVDTGMHGAQQTAPSHADCPEHDAEQPQAAASTDHSSCSACDDCQMCHTLAVTVASLTPPNTSQLHWLRPIGLSQFVSALPAPSLKPPIS